MSLLSKLTYMFYAVLISIPTKFCCKHRHANSNIFMERQRQILQKKKSKVERIDLLDFKSYDIAPGVKTTWCFREIDTGLMKKNKEPRNRPTRICPADFLSQVSQSNRGRVVLSPSGADPGI